MLASYRSPQRKLARAARPRRLQQEAYCSTAECSASVCGEYYVIRFNEVVTRRLKAAGSAIASRT